MSDHLQTHALGLMHLVLAIAAIVIGTIVVFNRKGTRRHRWLGRCYVALMIAVNVTSLLIYELWGRFGPFHWMALASLATLLAGYIPMIRKRPGWMYRHAYFISGSYVGVLAAAVAEVASRVPGWSFGLSVMISSLVVIALGVWLMLRLIPHVRPG